MANGKFEAIMTIFILIIFEFWKSVNNNKHRYQQVIYVAICKLCKDKFEVNNNFYIGQTVNSFISSCNGHRDKFKPERFDQSALSLHNIMNSHINKFNEKLNNFDFGVVKVVNPMDLDRTEDCLIYISKVDTVGLNRYKCSKF